jgi:CubicO group peptidase (beta-lactamase class C family)
MTTLSDTLQAYVDDGTLVGAVALVARGDDVEVVATGFVDAEATAPMRRDSIFRIASLTKPIIAAAAMMLVEDGRLELSSAVSEWLPELAAPMVVRTPVSAIDDVVPAKRAITVEDLQTFRCGYGFPSDFSYPAVGLLLSELLQGPPQPLKISPPDEWMARLRRVPMIAQPGQSWLYNASSDILGVLIARITGRPLGEFLAERIFAPLGMSDTAFFVPAASLDRFTSSYRPAESGGLELVDPPGGQWSSAPDFPSGAGGLVSTIDDLQAFARMLLADGSFDGHELLTAVSVRHMTTNHLTPRQRSDATLFLEGQGWGFGGTVDVDPIDPWNVAGRYGWIGGTGTAWHITPSTGLATVLLTQTEMTGPTTPPLMHDFWGYAQSSRVN